MGNLLKVISPPSQGHISKNVGVCARLIRLGVSEYCSKKKVSEPGPKYRVNMLVSRCYFRNAVSDGYSTWFFVDVELVFGKVSNNSE